MQRSRAIVGLVFLIFFVISFLTNILGPLVPDIISAFSLSLTLAGFLPFSFFVAYGVMSIPAGTLVERRGERVVMAASFAAACAGAHALRARAELPDRDRLAVPHRPRDGGAPGGDQPAAAGGRRRGALRLLLGVRAARLRARVLPEPPGLHLPRAGPPGGPHAQLARWPPSRGSCRRSCPGSRSTGSSPS